MPSTERAVGRDAEDSSRPVHSGLAKAQKARDTPIDQDKVMHLDQVDNMPWAKAAELEAEYIAKKKVSSVCPVS